MEINLATGAVRPLGAAPASLTALPRTRAQRLEAELKDGRLQLRVRGTGAASKTQLIAKVDPDDSLIHQIEIGGILVLAVRDSQRHDLIDVLYAVDATGSVLWQRDEPRDSFLFEVDGALALAGRTRLSLTDPRTGVERCKLEDANAPIDLIEIDSTLVAYKTMERIYGLDPHTCHVQWAVPSGNVVGLMHYRGRLYDANVPARTLLPSMRGYAPVTTSIIERDVRTGATLRTFPIATCEARSHLADVRIVGSGDALLVLALLPTERDLADGAP